MEFWQPIFTLFMELSWRLGALLGRYPWLVYALDIVEELV